MRERRFFTLSPQEILFAVLEYLMSRDKLPEIQTDDDFKHTQVLSRDFPLKDYNFEVWRSDSTHTHISTITLPKPTEKNAEITAKKLTRYLRPENESAEG